MKKTLGLIVNPIAGMGGAVGLKGTDGRVILEEAVSLGAKQIAPERAEVFLSKLKPSIEKIQLVTAAGNMGQEEAEHCGVKCIVLGEKKKETRAEDTKDIANKMVKAGVDLIVFCGGDGTARDILNAVGTKCPGLGVPTGVKMHSAVFAINPQAAARLAMSFLFDELPVKEVEVMDIDEQAFRKGRLAVELYGYLLTPYEPHLIQSNKIASPSTEDELRNQAAIALYIIDNMEPGRLYIVGPGTTTRTIGDLLDERKTLLGVDVFCDKKIVAKDVNEKVILKTIRGRRAHIIVTPIGGQGFIFGRGNQQISSEVIHCTGVNNITVVATEEKLRSLRSLRVDTGDAALDREFRVNGMKVISDYNIENKLPVE